jgi:hypothetical protein
MRFGRLIAIGRADGHWLCQCDCGNQKVIQGSRLRGGQTKSCGCYNREVLSARKTHGQTKSRTFTTWAAMKNRCHSSTSQWYSRYGGRGIKVCDRWLESFENFLADMGERPDGASIDRIDNDGNYEPSNCRWATRLQQERNKGSNRYFTINAERRALSEWCELYGANYQRVYARLLLGWDIEKALTAPHRDRKTCLHGTASSAPCAQCEQEIEATVC